MLAELCTIHNYERQFVANITYINEIVKQYEIMMRILNHFQMNTIESIQKVYRKLKSIYHLEG